MIQKTAAAKEPFFVHCGTCSHEWAAAYLPISVDIFVKLGKAPCPMCGAKKVIVGLIPKPTADGDAEAWLSNGDTGTSSKTIWHMLTGRPKSSLESWRYDVPHDPSDFGRCYRLLKVMPSWRARLPEVAKAFKEWAPLVNAWDELTALYEEELPRGTCPKLYQRMQELREE